MHTGTMIFLFDSGEVFQESWEMTAPSSEVALQKLRRIAQSRLPLLASSVRIVQLKVKGQPLQRVQMPGTGGTGAWARDALIVRDEGRETKKHLRGVPKEVFANGRLTPKGLTMFNEYNRTLRECGCVIVRKGDEPQPVRRIEPTHTSLFSWKKGKKATLRKLVALLGATEAERFWTVLKERRAAQFNLTSTG